MFLRKEAKKRNFKIKEEKEEKEAEWDASSEWKMRSNCVISRQRKQKTQDQER
jgi:hypothetical protein